MKYSLGIDEAGRGPLAGPVAVGAVRVGKSFDKKIFKGIKDSKKLSPQKREEWFLRAEDLQKAGTLDWAVALVSEKVIDKQGIAPAIRLGMKRCLQKLSANTNDHIFLDGGLKLPAEYIFQETIIKGDEKVAVISLASICAKVMRDRYMTKLSKKYPKYGFDIHKGYGTEVHIKAIKKHGASKAHRKSFLRNIDEVS
jgi:ribonuclease HII